MNHANVNVVELFPPWVECWACGEPTPSKWGLPIRIDTVELTSNDYEGDWGGVPACRECFEGHAQGLLTADTLQDWKHRRFLKQRADQYFFVRE